SSGVEIQLAPATVVLGSGKMPINAKPAGLSLDAGILFPGNGAQVAALNIRLPLASLVQVKGSHGTPPLRAPLKSPSFSAAVGTKAFNGPVPRFSRRHSSDQKKKAR